MPQEVVPIDPPASIANGSSESPICTVTSAGATCSASAAIWLSTVRAPVPMSAAAIITVNRPSGSARAIACDGRRRAG